MVYRSISVILFVGILFGAVLSCSKEDHDVALQKQETLCSNPWSNSFDNSESDVLLAVQHYLKENGVLGGVVEIEADVPGKANCFACTCPSGRIITVKAHPSQSDRLKELGFGKVD